MIFWLGTPSDEARALVDYMKWSEGRPNHGQPFADVYESDLLEQSLVSQLRLHSFRSSPTVFEANKFPVRSKRK